PNYQTIPFSNFWLQVQDHNIEKIAIDQSEITGKLKSQRPIAGQPVQTFRTYVPEGMMQWEFLRDLLHEMDKTTEIRAEPSNNILVNLVLPVIPWLLILGFIWFFVYR